LLIRFVKEEVLQILKLEARSYEIRRIIAKMSEGSPRLAIIRSRAHVVCMYHYIEYPLYRDQHCVTVYLSKYKSPGR